MLTIRCITDQVNNFGPHFVPRFMLGRGQADCWHAVYFLWKAGVVMLANTAGRKLSTVISVQWGN